MPPKLQLTAAEIESIESRVDQAFLALCGKTYRHASLPHGSQNGSGRPQDSLEQIRADFPELFGKGDDAA
jgi:hypothetical protein